MTNSIRFASANAIRLIAAASVAAVVLCLSGAASAQQKEDIQALNERLFEAVRSNDIATVRSTLTSGADPVAVDKNGQTPAGVAVDRGYFDIAHHILAIRNQRQAQRERLQEEEQYVMGTSAVGTAPAERGVQQTWRDTMAPGQATEIPTARLSSPQEPVVVTPVRTKAPEQTKRPAAAASRAVGTATAPSAPGAPALANLPRLPSGAPNPFDPENPEPVTPPTISTAVPAPIPAAQEAPDSPRPAPGGNVFTRFFNGITGVFGGGGS